MVMYLYFNQQTAESRPENTLDSEEGDNSDSRQFSIVRDDRRVTPSLHLCTCIPPRTITRTQMERWRHMSIVTYNRKLPIINFPNAITPELGLDLDSNDVSIQKSVV